MSEFWLVSKQQMEELGNLLQRIATLHDEILASAGSMSFPATPGPISMLAPLPPDATRVTKEQAENLKVDGRYEIRPGALSYADVVAWEISDAEFTLDDAVARIKDLILTRSPRWRESLRRALDNDDRFARMSWRTGDWYRRTDLTGEHATEEDDELPF